MHEEHVMEFYYNVEFIEDGSLNTQVGDKAFYLNEERLAEILNVPRKGIDSWLDDHVPRTLQKSGKLSQMNCVGISKKLLKGDSQVLFEFVNKVLLLRLVVELSQLKQEEMTALVSQKEAEIALLKAQMEGPGSTEVSKFKAKNEALLAQIFELKEKLIKLNNASNDRLSFVIQSLTQKLSSS
ncbi:hypothetical protein H5410_056191 [Solanum commersonii]|uniref:Uncharacterized protein n=1 Tax=Solanum commersonii TaxID=4109 RepID=A0A9J5WJK9_SOLCO|nr:hypothetical protein H5410_056191 [Solanum commersonii]